jgi:hypothetical protein
MGLGFLIILVEDTILSIYSIVIVIEEFYHVLPQKNGRHG